MNLAIFGNDELSHFVSDAIKKFYNPFLIQQNKEPINVVAFVVENNARWGGIFVQ